MSSEALAFDDVSTDVNEVLFYCLFVFAPVRGHRSEVRPSLVKYLHPD